jgi:putative glutamine transport system substrate-binding protein
MALGKFRTVAPLTALVLLMLALLVSCSSRPGTTTTTPSASPDLLDTVRQRGYLLVGVKFDSKPFGYLDVDGQVKGYDVDLIRAIATKLFGVPDAVRFQQVLSSTRVIAIQSGTLDFVAATMTITPERAEVIDFSDVYYTAGQGILVPQAAPVRTLANLAGKTILYVIGSTSGKNIQARLPKARYVGFKTATDAFSALKAGRGDALTSDDIILSGFAADACDFRMLEGRLSQEPYGLGFQKSPRTTRLRTAVNTWLQQFRADGTLARLEAKWVGRPTRHETLCHGRLDPQAPRKPSAASL